MRSRKIACMITVMLMATVTLGQAKGPLDQHGQPIPDELKDVRVDEHPGATLPLDATFHDEQGRTVRLGDYFTGQRPVILQLGYYSCPMLCGLVTNGMMDAMRQIPLELGKDYEVINISIDPAENFRLSALKKQNYVSALGKPGGAAWHFLVGTPENIQRVTEAVGFRYKWDESQKQFAHPAVLIVLTPDGRVSRYLYGVMYAGQTVRLSLVEASQGKIGSTTDRILLYCFHYDSAEGRYTPVARAMMSLGGAVTVLVLGLVLLRQYRRDARKKREGAKTA